MTIVQQVGSFVASGFYTASPNGVLVYRSSVSAQSARMQWWTREGAYSINPEQPGGIHAIAISPDGSRAALARQDTANATGDIWICETTGDSGTRVTFDTRRAESAVWTPDASQIVFTSNREGPWNLYRKRSNESKEDELLVKSAQDKFPTSISADGRFLLYTQASPQTRNDIWTLSNPAGGPADRRPAAFLETPANETEARFSPAPEAGSSTGSRWVAYVSDESGRNEVYVREFSLNGTGGKWTVSRTGAANPRWRKDGKELFFAALDGTVMSIDVGPGATFQASAPKTLFRVPSGILPNWDVTPDGKRFLLLVLQDAQAPFTVWQNWESALKD